MELVLLCSFCHNNRCDQLTKALVLQGLNLHQTVTVILGALFTGSITRALLLDLVPPHLFLTVIPLILFSWSSVSKEIARYPFPFRFGLVLSLGGPRESNRPALE